MTATRTLRFWGIPAVAGLWLVAAYLLWRTSVPAGLELPDLDAREVFGPEHVDRSARYERGLRLFWLGAVAVELTALALVAWLAPRWRGRGIAAGGGPPPPP